MFVVVDDDYVVDWFWCGCVLYVLLVFVMV